MARWSETRARPGVVVLALLAMVLASGGAVHEWHSLWLVRRAAVSRAIWPEPHASGDATTCAPFAMLAAWSHRRRDGRGEELAVEHWWQRGASLEELPPISPEGYRHVDPPTPLLTGECPRRERASLDRLVLALSLASSEGASPGACLASTVRAISIVRVPGGREDRSVLIDRARALERLGREARRCAAEASPEARSAAVIVLRLLALRRSSLDDTLQMLGRSWAQQLVHDIDDAVSPHRRGVRQRPFYALHRYAALRALLGSRPPSEVCASLDEAACVRAMRRIVWPDEAQRDASKLIELADDARASLERLARDVAPPRGEQSR